VGRLDERKGLPTLLAAWSHLLRLAWPTPPLLRIAGDGPLREHVRRWQQRLSHPGTVELLGWTEEMPAFHASLTVLAVPSRYEGFGLAAAEAQAAGRPVVAAAASSLPELVRHGETGLLVPGGHPALLAAALARLLADPALARRLGAAGRRWIETRFSRQRMLDRLEELLHAAGVERGGAP
jgi:glycosyltransferase involved in cell wall biosynthesis